MRRVGRMLFVILRACVCAALIGFVGYYICYALNWATALAMNGLEKAVLYLTTNYVAVIWVLVVLAVGAIAGELLSAKFSSFRKNKKKRKEENGDGGTP